MTHSTPWAGAFGDVGWKLPDILTVDATARAADHLESYMHHDEHKGPDYSGSFFHRLGGGGDSEETKNIITATDLVALTTLNINVDAQTSIGLLTDLQEWTREQIGEDIQGRDHTSYVLPQHPDQLSGLLSQLPTSPGLEDLSDGDMEEYAECWDKLYEVVRRKGLGPTSVHKLFARKRPHLIPIYDSYIGSQLNTNSRSFFRNLHSVLHAENGAFADHLRMIRGDVDVSLIRVFDIVVWREEEQKRKLAGRGD